MSPTPEVIVHADFTLLTRAIAARFVTRLVDVQAARGRATIALTGGGAGIGVLRELRDSRVREAVDWSRLDIWWSDERYVAAGDAERNDQQAREALLDIVPVDPRRVHAAPASDGEFGADVEAAAAWYAAQLEAAAAPEDHSDVPTFDLALLGIGPEGHVASIFPQSPAAYDDRSVVAVRSSPKPPPNRISFTLRTINAAREVWFVASGADKAAAVRMALSGAGALALPAAGVSGTARTLWLLDRPAASQLPGSLSRLASP